MSHHLAVIAAALGATTEVNGGELEPVTSIYRPEGLAVLVDHALREAGFVVVNPAETAEDCEDPWVCCIHERPEAER